MFAGVYQAQRSYMPIREDDPHKSVVEQTMSFMQSEHFKRQKILLSTELKLYFKCIWNLANSDTSTANGKNKFGCDRCNIYSKKKLELSIKSFRQPNTLRTKNKL